jgi:hypothetical protein
MKRTRPRPSNHTGIAMPGMIGLAPSTANLGPLPLCMRMRAPSRRRIHNKLKYFVQLVAFGLCVSNSTSSAQPSVPLTTKSQGAPGKYRVLDSGTRAHTFGATDPQFYWINNDELLFLAIHQSPDPSATKKEKLNYVVSRWHIQRGTVLQVRNFGESRPSICYYAGQVIYQFRRPDDSIEAYQGKLGDAERAVDPNRYARFCQRLEDVPKLPAWTAGREIRWLQRIDAGFIDFGDEKKWQENTRVRFYRHGAQPETGVELPFGRRDIAPRFPYYEFRDAFFVESHYWVHPRPKEIPYPVFWLHRDGRIERIADIPWGPWRSAASFFPFPTRVGLVMASSNFNVRNSNDLAHAGIYLLSDGRVNKLLTAWIEGLGVAVSPNGCKIGFTYAPIVTRKNNILQAIDLCEGT